MVTSAGPTRPAGGTAIAVPPSADGVPARAASGGTASIGADAIASRRWGPEAIEFGSGPDAAAGWDETVTALYTAYPSPTRPMPATTDTTTRVRSSRRRPHGSRPSTCCDIRRSRSR